MRTVSSQCWHGRAARQLASRGTKRVERQKPLSCVHIVCEHVFDHCIACLTWRSGKSSHECPQAAAVWMHRVFRRGLFGSPCGHLSEEQGTRQLRCRLDHFNSRATPAGAHKR